MVLEDEASVASAKASVHQAEVNLSHCSIYAPTDGVIISRNVDEGQTVAAQMSAPSLYLLGTDLRRLQLIGDVDESDVGRLRPGQQVTFTVDAYPGTQFGGGVTNVRLNSTTTNNVVTYQVVIAVANPDLRLLPGMTGSLTIKISSAPDVVRVPNAALRFRPTSEMFKAFGQPVPAPKSLSARAAGAADGTAPQSSDRSGDSPSSNNQPASRARPTAGRARGDIDEFFEPVQPRRAAAEVWKVENGRLVGVPIVAGRSDGRWTELISGDLHAGDELVTAVIPRAAARK
jgi:HlyD family secretion protein